MATRDEAQKPGTLVVLSLNGQVVASAVDFSQGGPDGLSVEDHQQRGAHQTAWYQALADYGYGGLGEAICGDSMTRDRVVARLKENHGWAEKSFHIDANGVGSERRGA